ncbi:hypothetical protein ACFC4G_44055 [Streptomyces sp. NPDC056002]|uniref:hypothetical protein n=1 Tax=Streptomyces sp. NPDC056002 TaxID=3345675 RepID=UPI0035DFAA4B
MWAATTYLVAVTLLAEDVHEADGIGGLAGLVEDPVLAELADGGVGLVERCLDDFRTDLRFSVIDSGLSTARQRARRPARTAPVRPSRPCP